MDRMLPKILENGTSHQSAKGHLKKWISGQFSMYKANDMRIYGEFAFFFKQDVLVTVYEIPPSLRRLAQLS